MARLPVSGEENWGGTLNEYLTQSMTEEGTLKTGVVTEDNLDPSLQAKVNGTTNVDGSSDGSLQTIYHNNNAATIRPITVSPVIWIGIVRPINWVNGDIWFTASPTNPPVTPTLPTDNPPEVSPLAGLPSGVIAYYTVLDLASTANNATVTSWPNRVADAAPLTNAKGTPKYDAINKAVVYDGVDDRHDAAINAPQPSTTIAVGRYITATPSRAFVSGITTVNGVTATSASLWSMNGGAALNHGARIDTNWHFVESRFNGLGSSLMVDSLRVSGNAGTNPRTGLRIGSNTALSGYSNLAMKAVLVFNRALTPQEVEDVRSKLASDLGMTL